MILCYNYVGSALNRYICEVTWIYAKPENAFVSAQSLFFNIILKKTELWEWFSVIYNEV